ncbi:winged helix DNA-binding protein [Tateyamaria omphalii]|uniref:MarR family winged helix-turn-helix transcriptional regulator n=1 Tax=Tateyamaria omphalii TaxID=299262 RepID=UPI001C99B419|nr:MarR family transcriptional regulator [Tateyamaria omphalii]MBY5933530.1 winged helix DNA-binding protein [Tateyamaria omphalii]
MANQSQTPDRIAELLVHIGRAARSEDANTELTAAQWTCLRFFARANGTTRTPSAFASFQATTRGTASQIIKSVERRGLIVGTRSEHDRRSFCFDLTDEGRAMLAQDPLRDLIKVIDGLGASKRDRFLATLSEIASALALQRDVPSFGTCRGCTHFGTSGDAAYCACMSAELAADDIAKLCASYVPSAAVKK